MSAHMYLVIVLSFVTHLSLICLSGLVEATLPLTLAYAEETKNYDVILFYFWLSCNIIYVDMLWFLVFVYWWSSRLKF